MSEFDNSLITIEGIDKSGKSTLVENLRAELEQCEFTQEPSHGKYGRIMREELSNGDDPTLSDFFLFMADRFDHCHSHIGPLLDSGTDVICDRYQLSTYAYQNSIVDRDADPRSVDRYIRRVTDGWVIEPDLTIYIDLPIGEALSRIDAESEKYEREDVLHNAKKIYDSYCFSETRVERIDGNQSEEEVLEDALDLIESETS